MSDVNFRAATDKKDLLQCRIEIAEIQKELGLDEADPEADHNRKIIERAKLQQQKERLEKQIAHLARVRH